VTRAVRKTTRKRKPKAVAPAPVAACRACSAELTGRYCGACGLDSHTHRRRWGELVEEFLETFYEIAVLAPRTFAALFFRPQRLAVGLRDGDHRYPTPFKLYVTASAIFFLFLAVTGVSIFQVRVHRTPGIEPAIVVDQAGTIHAHGYWLEDRFLHPRSAAPRDPVLVRTLTEARDRTSDPNPRTSLELVRRIADDPAWINEDVETWAPRVLWLLMPIYALLLWPLFRRAPYLSDHFIFAVWAHTTLYLLLILGALWNMTGMVWGLGVTLALFQVYLTVGLRAYYQSSWAGAVVKGAVHSALYFVLCWLPVVVAFFIWQVLEILPGQGG
jgi:hypothetical protein